MSDEQEIVDDEFVFDQDGDEGDENEDFQFVLNERCAEIENSIPKERRVYGTKMLLAGCESSKIRDSFVRIGVKNILVSYYYLRKKKRSIDELREDFGRFDFVFLDSGGFTLLQQLANENKTSISVKQYTEEYAQFMLETRGIWKACAEVDVEKELGRRYMEDLKDSLFKEGVPIVPVLQSEPIEFVRDNYGWFGKYPYVAMGSAVNMQGIMSRARESYIREGKKYGTLLHGLAMTDARTLRRSAFYSVDSTSWSSGARFGATMIFQNGRIRVYDKNQKSVRKRFKQRFIDNGLSWELIEKDDNFEVDMLNAFAWKECSDFIGNIVRESYWLTKEEKQVAIDRKSEEFKSVSSVGGVKDLVVAGELAPTPTGNMNDNPIIDEVLFCDTCYLAGKCPKYKAEQRCMFRFRTIMSTKEGMMSALAAVMEIQADRVARGSLFEKVEGGIIDKNLSSEISMFMEMMGKLKDMMDNRDEVVIKAKGTGILQKLFGNQGG